VPPVTGGILEEGQPVSRREAATMWRRPRLPREPVAWENGERILVKQGLDPERARKIIGVVRRGLDLPLVPGETMSSDPSPKRSQR